ncbi:MAG: glycosyltransferase family 39 protein, partial [Acidobacteria bacterium]|nr:glycosyltransferase family 39 protein [Acidobacteriota bacterium]
MLKRTEWWMVPAAALLVHLFTWQGYGWFRDEFYYVVCARNLAWGYVDHPPLSIVVLRLVIGVFGESLQVIRAVPAIAHAATVLLSGLIVRELHGGRFAARVAMVSAAAAPMVMSLSFFYSMNAFDLTLWCGAVYAVLIALRTERDSAWACVGLWLGLGLLNKVSVLWLGGGLGVALMLTPYRAVIMRRGVWLAAGVAALIFAPHIVWQMQHHWPTLEFMQSASANKMVARSVLTFTRAAIADQGPVVALLGVMGLIAAFSRWIDPRARILAWIFIAVFALLALNGTSRTGYLAPAW